MSELEEQVSIAVSRKPSIQRAAQWDGRAETAQAIVSWIVDEGVDAEYNGDSIVIFTPNGPASLYPGGWAIKGVAEGDFYPCTPEGFAGGFNRMQIHP